MSKIQNYIPGKLCQIQLDSDEKVLISVAPTEIKVFLLGFLNIPKQCLYTFEVQAYNRLKTLDSDTLGYISSQLLLTGSTDELIDSCKSMDDFAKLLLTEG